MLSDNILTILPLDIYYRYGKKNLPLWQKILFVSVSIEKVLWSFVYFFKKTYEQEKETKQSWRIPRKDFKKAQSITKRIQHFTSLDIKEFRTTNNMRKMWSITSKGQIYQLGK